MLLYVNYKLIIVSLAITPDRFSWYYWGWFSQYLACMSTYPLHVCQWLSNVSTPVSCNVYWLQSAVYLVLVCWWWWFDWSFAHHVAAVVNTTSVTPIKCRMETFWYQLTQFYLENGRWNGERASGCVVCRGSEWSYTVCADWSPVRFGFADDSHETGWLIRALVPSRLKCNNHESYGEVFVI